MVGSLLARTLLKPSDSNISTRVFRAFDKFVRSSGDVKKSNVICGPSETERERSRTCPCDVGFDNLRVIIAPEDKSWFRFVRVRYSGSAALHADGVRSGRGTNPQAEVNRPRITFSSVKISPVTPSSVCHRAGAMRGFRISSRIPNTTALKAGGSVSVPTVGLSVITGTPCSRRCTAGPIPDAISKMGVLKAPAASTTSPSLSSTNAWCKLPDAALRYSTPTARFCASKIIRVTEDFVRTVRFKFGRRINISALDLLRKLSGPGRSV
mmetsp:Transcript_12500/g.37551  ORF Transcript_12500/g.37551 Transcript_12500/m.37551 type:complete len:267 (-) Transcript_12500:1843-2643(-)